MPILKDEDRYKILKLLSKNADMTQRELADSLGISLGKANYCLKSLVDIGMIKVGNFRRNANKGVYAYLLTPKGLEEKGKVTMRFLHRKLEEVELLQKEIENLRVEAANLKAVNETV